MGENYFQLTIFNAPMKKKNIIFATKF